MWDIYVCVCVCVRTSMHTHVDNELLKMPKHLLTLVEIFSFAIILVIFCNYKFVILQFLGYTIVCATNMQLNVYNMNMCHKIMV
jgi:hypothetical protein